MKKTVFLSLFLIISSSMSIKTAQRGNLPNFSSDISMKYKLYFDDAIAGGDIDTTYHSAYF